MIKLEELREDAIVTGLQPGERARVVRVQALGNDARTVTYKDANGALHERVVFRGDEVELDLVEEGARWGFSADPEQFKLGVEAQRIRLAHLFDPMMAVHTSSVEPLPHQISAVYEHMLEKQPLRYVLADDPGAGKTIMAGLFIRELILRADAERILIIAPGSLVEQWQDELWEKFELTFQIFGHEMQNASPSRNAFDDHNQLIARLDQISRNDDFLELLEQTHWDLIVVDEAHKMSATYFGNKVSETKRFKLGKLLGRITRHFLLMTATPHNGKEADFQMFMSLLDGDRFYGKFRQGVHKVNVDDLMRRMVKEDLLKFDGSKLFPERRAHTVNYELSDLEAALYAEVTEYVRNEMNRAERLAGQQKGAVGFALTLLQRRLASSPEAIFQSLKRRRKRLESRVEEERLVQRGHHIAETLAEYRVALTKSPDDAEEELSASEYEEMADELVDEASTAQTIEELELEINTLKSLEGQAKRVVESRQDRKWDELSNLLQDNPAMFSEGEARRKLIIFTEHKDTLNYLIERIGGLLGKPEAVVSIHGGVGRDDRRKIQEVFWTNPEVLILVATDAAGEGVNLQVANLMINYDLPWNPNRLEQRFGRIHRIGQQQTCHLWNLVATETREGDVFQRLFDKLEIEREALGGRVFDILGEAFEGRALRELIIDAIRYGDQPEKHREILRNLDESLDTEHLQQIIQRNALVESSLSMEHLYSVREQMEKAEARKLHPLYIQSFFQEAFAHLGGDLRPRERGRYEISHVPARIRERDRRIGSGRTPVMQRYERVCFEKNRIQIPHKRQASLVHPGHPLMQAVNDLICEDYRHTLDHGAVLVDPADYTTEPRVLLMLEHSVRETHGEAPRVVSRRLQFVNAWSDGRFTHAGWAPHLAMQPLDSEHQQLADAARNQEWIQALDERSILGFAAEKLIPEHFDEIQRRRREQVDKTKTAVKDRLMREIEFQWDRYHKLTEEVEAGKQPRIQPDNARREAERLTARLEARIAELDAQRELASSSPRVLSAALIVPAGLIARHEGRDDLTVSARARARIESMAMQVVTEAERALGHEVRDVSADNCGWDITARPPVRDGLLPPSRHIEVKGRAAGQEIITVTSNEIRAGLNQGDKFYLAIVLIDGDQVDGPHYIRRPFDQEPGWAESSRNLSLKDLLVRARRPGDWQ